MNAADYLDRLLYRYGGTFDIQTEYPAGRTVANAYGYFYSHTEKYVLVREANLWTSNCFEHILFYQVDRLEEGHIRQADDVIRNYMEPELVLKGGKYPDKHHMYSYLTIVFISQEAPEQKALRMLKKYSFDRGYQFHLRGFSQARLIAASMEGERVYTNYAGKKSKALYHEVFKDVRQEKKGFSAYQAEQANIHME